MEGQAPYFEEGQAGDTGFQSDSSTELMLLPEPVQGANGLGDPPVQRAQGRADRTLMDEWGKDGLFNE